MLRLIIKEANLTSKDSAAISLKFKYENKEYETGIRASQEPNWDETF